MVLRNLLQTYGYIHTAIQRENDLHTNFFSTSRKTEQCDTPKKYNTHDKVHRPVSYPDQ